MGQIDQQERTIRKQGDLLVGGEGHDTADYRASKPLAIELDNVANDGAGGKLDNVCGDIEHVIGGSERDVVNGNGGPNVLDGRDGDDTITGGEGTTRPTQARTRTRLRAQRAGTHSRVARVTTSSPATTVTIQRRRGWVGCDERRRGSSSSASLPATAT